MGSNNLEFDKLVAGFLSGTISEEDSAKLSHYLESSPECRKRWVEHLSLHASLRTMHQSDFGLETAGQLTVATTEPSGTSAQRRYRNRVLLAASSLAASLLIAALLYAWVGRDDRVLVEGTDETEARPTDSYVAVIVDTEDARWSLDSRGSIGTEMQAGEAIHLTSGSVRLDLPVGATVSLKGPAQVTLTGKESLKLHHGDLAARVTNDEVRLQVETPSGRIVDLGTEFLVSVSESGFGTVQVLDGEVEVYNDNVKTPQRLSEGEQLELSPQNIGGNVEKLSLEKDAVAQVGFLRRGDRTSAVLAHWRFGEVGPFGPNKQYDCFRDSSIHGHHLEWYSNKSTYLSSAGGEEGYPLRLTIANDRKVLQLDQRVGCDWIVFIEGSADITDKIEHVPAVHRAFTLSAYTVEAVFRTSRDEKQALVTYGPRFNLLIENGQLYWQAAGRELSLGEVGEFCDGQWHYVAASIDEQQRVMSLRSLSGGSSGFQRKEGPAARMASSWRNLSIGGDRWFRAKSRKESKSGVQSNTYRGVSPGQLFGPEFVGQIDEIRIANRILADEELLAFPQFQDDRDSHLSLE